jgi:transposase InsO family protein
VDVSGVDHQCARRKIEAEVRKEAVAYEALVVTTGGTKEDAAADLGVSPRTLRSWVESPGGTELRGRPRVVLTEERAEEVRESLDDLGPRGGVATLKHLHPAVTRRNLKGLVTAYREAYIKDHGLFTEKLKWPESGTVWTLDHTELPVPATEGERYALSVRDLGSGFQLLWEPVQSPDATSTVRLLLDLFFKHGAPLVLKSDNGSAFIAWLTKKLLAWWSVMHLLSPPRRPGYNGFVEVGMQWLKPRTEHAARRAGHGGALRPEDFAHARKVVNEITWPERSGGDIRPIDLWESRRAIAATLRSAFSERVAAEERELRAGLEGVPGKRALAKARRDAIRRALVAYGFLLVRRRPITPRELARKAANNR